MTIDDYLRLIDEADVYDVARQTPLELATNLSQRLGNRILMKREDLQSVFSFKLRGAYNKIANLPQAALDAGVICSSAGNHAQGVALAAQRRGVRAVIVMPVTTPSIKVDAVISLGGEVILHGDNYDDAYARARELEQEQGLTFIHAFNDPAVIAGQGTIGREILEQLEEDVQAIFVPIGGGGLIAGIAAYVKGKRPDIKIIGVEPADSAAMRDSLAAGKVVTLDHVGIFADGVAVRRVGDDWWTKWSPSIPTRFAQAFATSSRTLDQSSNRPERWRLPAPRNTSQTTMLKVAHSLLSIAAPTSTSIGSGILQNVRQSANNVKCCWVSRSRKNPVAFACFAKRSAGAALPNSITATTIPERRTSSSAWSCDTAQQSMRS